MDGCKIKKYKKPPAKKMCPVCGSLFHVAVKTCNECRHSFFASKKNLTLKTTQVKAETVTATSAVEKSNDACSTSSDGLRRTKRVRRPKPKYYDASSFTSKKSKQTDNLQDFQDKEFTQPKKEVTSQKQNYNTEIVHDPEDEFYDLIMKTEKSKVCASILSELNEKLMLTSWCP